MILKIIIIYALKMTIIYAQYKIILLKWETHIYQYEYKNVRKKNILKKCNGDKWLAEKTEMDQKVIHNGGG